MWQLFFYNLFLRLYVITARLIQAGNNKAALWLKGRKHIFEQVSFALQHNSAPLVWFHAASIGEFEQGRPLMEAIKMQFQSYKIIVTFFSPSGYEAKKDDPIADWVFYLPMDSAANAANWIQITNPTLVIFIKYEFWYYYLKNLQQKNIPTLLISGIFRANQPFFKWYGSMHRFMLQCFQHLFVQNQQSKILLDKLGLAHCTSIAGDTRFDRVLYIAKEFYQNESIEKMIGHRQVIVAGSTWTEDDEVLDHYANIHPELFFIIAPHEVDADRIKECTTLYKNSICYSAVKVGADFTEKNVLIIDNIGMLSKLYRYATICYVGGGFGDDGVHNVLEPAVYNKPVVFGPVYDKFFEATALVDLGGAFSVDDAISLEEVLNKLLNNTDVYMQACNASGKYVSENTGSTAGIIQYIQENRLLTNA
jgi:3-deoxy-D-manno-octulosonic-acid transferase